MAEVHRRAQVAVAATNLGATGLKSVASVVSVWRRPQGTGNPPFPARRRGRSGSTGRQPCLLRRVPIRQRPGQRTGLIGVQAAAACPCRSNAGQVRLTAATYPAGARGGDDAEAGRAHRPNYGRPAHPASVRADEKVNLGSAPASRSVNLLSYLQRGIARSCR
jgi:hypothetical protein